MDKIKPRIIRCCKFDFNLLELEIYSIIGPDGESLSAADCPFCSCSMTLDFESTILEEIKELTVFKENQDFIDFLNTGKIS